MSIVALERVPLASRLLRHGVSSFSEEDTHKRGAAAPDTSLPRLSLRDHIAAGRSDRPQAPWDVRPGCRARVVRTTPDVGGKDAPSARRANAELDSRAIREAHLL